MMTTSGTCQIGGRAESLAESKETVDSAMSRRHGEKRWDETVETMHQRSGDRIVQIR